MSYSQCLCFINEFMTEMRQPYLILNSKSNSSLFIFLQMQISSFWRMLSLVLNDEMLLNSQINSCNKSPVSHICISSKLPQRLLCFLVWAGPLGWLTGLVACCQKRCSSTVGVFSSAKVKTGNLHSKGYKALFQAKHFFLTPFQLSCYI